MKVSIQKPRNFINPLLSRKAVNAEKFNAFKLALEHYKKSLADQISTKQTEPNIVTNTLKPFLDSFGFLSEAYSQKGQISIDLAVIQNSKPLVIIEAKMPNSADMILAHDLHKKSFFQAIMYFMNERAKHNTSLFHLSSPILTTGLCLMPKILIGIFGAMPQLKSYTTHTPANHY